MISSAVRNELSKKILSLAAAAQLASISEGAVGAPDNSKTEPNLGINPLSLDQSLSPRESPDVLRVDFVPQKSTNLASAPLVNTEPPFPLEGKLGLKTPLLSGIYPTNQFDKIEEALLNQFEEYLNGRAHQANLAAYKKEIRLKSDFIKVKRSFIERIKHLGEKYETVRNWGKYRLLADIGRKQTENGTNVVNLQPWSLGDIKFENIKTIVPLRTIIREDAGRFLSVYEVTTHTNGVRYAVISDNIPHDQFNLRTLLLKDPTIFKRGPIDFAGFVSDDLTHVPAETFRGYLKRDEDAIAVAFKEGNEAGHAGGKKFKFKIKKPKEWYIGLKGTSYDGVTSYEVSFSWGEYGIGIGYGPTKLQISPILNLGVGGSLHIPLTVYESPKAPRGADLAARQPITEDVATNEKQPTKAPPETKKQQLEQTSKPAKASENSFDESQDRLFAARWKQDPGFKSVLEKNGFIMQGIFDEDRIVPFRYNPIYFDEYSIIVKKAPSGNSPEALLAMLLNNPNGFLRQNSFDAMSTFVPKRTSGSPTKGDTYHIDILGPNNGSVILVEKTPTYFIFQTVDTSTTGYHPENGAREFGFERLKDGSIRFYTRATASSADIFTEVFGGPPQRFAWEALLDGLKDKIEFFGGEVQKAPPVRRHEMLEQPPAPLK